MEIKSNNKKHITPSRPETVELLGERLQSGTLHQTPHDFGGLFWRTQPQEGWELFDVEVIGIDKKEEPTYICWYKRPLTANNPGKLPDPKGEWNKLLIE